MFLQNVEAFPRLQIPQSNRLIITAACQELTIGTIGRACIWRIGNRSDRACVPLQNLQTGSSLQIPQSNRLVMTAACQLITTGINCQCEYGSRVFLQYAQTIPSLHIP
jgi:ADP-dependent phosphofructokinase/glucokinase